MKLKLVYLICLHPLSAGLCEVITVKDSIVSLLSSWVYSFSRAMAVSMQSCNGFSLSLSKSNSKVFPGPRIKRFVIFLFDTVSFCVENNRRPFKLFPPLSAHYKEKQPCVKDYNGSTDSLDSACMEAHGNCTLIFPSCQHTGP